MTINDTDVPFAYKEASLSPRTSYPRPDLDRSARWLPLNGDWDFFHDGNQSTIVVPFAWETPASGIGRTWLEAARYERSVVVPSHWGDARVVLCFGAVHHHATVSIDGIQVGTHTGGYTSFEFDVTHLVTVGVASMLVVEVTAPADKRHIVHGKQRSIPRDDYDGVSFTPTSGIWQDVWLEARGGTYATVVELRGESRTGIDVRVQVEGDETEGTLLTATVVNGGYAEPIALKRDSGAWYVGRIELEHPRLWSPTDPHLYRVRIDVSDAQCADVVEATVGLRVIEVRQGEIFLNDERLYIRGVLDQGYWLESGLTAPSDEALLADIDLARELGYNLIRKHLKFEEPRWLHRADQLGVLVWAEPACPSRFSDEAALAFEQQIEPMVRRDGNHPSIVIWGLYNEEWGLDWNIPGSEERAAAAVRAYDLLAAIDHTRPIVENSGWAHVRTDLVDWHYYEPDIATWARNVADLASGKREDFPVRLGPDFVVDKSLYGNEDFPRTGVALLNSEYGEGATSLERAWHLRWETQELRRHDRFVGYVYTELADVEHEGAGLLDAARAPKDWGGLIPSDVNSDTVLVLNMVPKQAGADLALPVAEHVMEVHVSHHGPVSVSGRIEVGWAAFGAPMNAGVESPTTVGKVAAKPFELSESFEVVVPQRDSPGRLILRFVDDAGVLRARSFLDAAVVEPPNRRGARTARE